jgi:hypothetical protein
MRLAQDCTRFKAVVTDRCNAYVVVIEKMKPRRGKTMFGPIKKFANSLRPRSIEEREMAYLNGSNDRFDLEYRQRQVDRGLFRQL